MTEIFGQVYNDIADESLEELRSEMGYRNTEKYTVSINTGESYD